MVVTPSRVVKPVRVCVKDLRAMAAAHKNDVDELRNYTPQDLSDDSDMSKGSASTMTYDPDADVGGIFQSWVDKSTSSEDLIKSSTHFTTTEFKSIWINIQHLIKSNWNVGSGRQSTTHAMDALLMVMVQMK